MPATETSGEIRATLFVRDSLPTPARRCSQRTIARLERLAADGIVGNATVTSWAKRLPIDGTDAPSQRDWYNEFSQWAREHDARLAPFFDTRECYSMTTGEKRTEIVFPAVCLAIYEDDELVTVAPHATEDGTTSVGDCLDRLTEQPGDEQDQRRTLAAD